MAAYVKEDTDTDTTISSTFGQHVQEQYDDAKAEYEAGNWTRAGNIKLPCPVKVTGTASQDGVGTDTENIDPSAGFAAWMLDQIYYDGTFGANQSGTIKAVFSDDSEVTLLTISSTTTGTKTTKDILDSINAKKTLYIKRVEVEVVGAAGASGVASLAATVYGHQT